jgi:hypothetical protein
MFADKLGIRVSIKAIVLIAAGLSGLIAQKQLSVAIILFAVSVAFGVADYLLSERITTLVLERITGIMESAYTCCGFASDADVRATIFVPLRNNKDKLRQVGRYYPTNKYSIFRRGLSTSKGIIGLCYRSKERCLEVIRQESSFKAHLVSKWGFTQEEADQVKTRRSYLAIPLIDRQGNALGVAYFDSMKEDTFTPDNVDILTKACVPLSKWVR